MKKSNFFKKVAKLEQEWADYTYGQCYAVQDKLNWKGSHVELLDTTRVFFFAKKNFVVLVDRANDYKRSFRNPTLALKEIDSWLAYYYRQDANV